MKQATQPRKRFRFGIFEADPRTGELTKSGKRVRLQEQPFQLLTMLLEKPGELVVREELRARLWPKTIVDFDHGLNKAISKVRDALGDSADNPRFIETVASRGYRFLADVAVVLDGQQDTAAGDPSREISAAPNTPVSGTLTRWRVHALGWKLSGVATVLALAVCLSWFVYWWRHPSFSIHSLAVLPLENLSSDASQDYFADGMTDELITHLGKISAIRVISRTSAMTSR
jgi:DNA-binding winged helix-turn-helix (wHTH) protein